LVVFFVFFFFCSATTSPIFPSQFGPVIFLVHFTGLYPPENFFFFFSATNTRTRESVVERSPLSGLFPTPCPPRSRKTFDAHAGDAFFFHVSGSRDYFEEASLSGSQRSLPSPDPFSFFVFPFQTVSANLRGGVSFFFPLFRDATVRPRGGVTLIFPMTIFFFPPHPTFKAGEVALQGFFGGR